MNSTITPYICVANAAKALEFYKQAFGATEVMRLEGPGDKIMHAEISINGATLMLADEFPEWGFLSPDAGGVRSSQLHLMVDKVDEFVDRAVQAGAQLERPVQNEFYGLRSGNIRDPFGHLWAIATEVEKLTNDEIKARAAKMMGGQ